MNAGSFFASAVVLGTACSVMTGVWSSTTDDSSYGSYSYSYSYDLHPDYPYCDSSYALSYIGNGYCSTVLNVAECGWDGGDCCACTCNSNYSYYCTSDYYCEDPSASLYLGDLGCQNTSYQVPQGRSCPGHQVYRVVNSTAAATTLAEETVCSGGSFEVEWRGPVNVTTTIHVLNGTRLNIIGVSDAVADGGGIVRIFLVSNGSLELNNIKVTNGTGSEGGAIVLDDYSELFADSVSFSSNIATNLGGAVYALSSTVELVSTTFDGNSARNGGAMFVHDSEVFAIGESNFTGNEVSENGGALYITGDSHVGWNMQFNKPLIDFPSSYPSYYYSSWYDRNAFWTTIDGGSGETTFLNNSAGWSGGAIYADDSEVSSLGTTLMERNKAWSGGAIYLENSADVKIEGTTILISNDAIFDGGAIGATGDGGDFAVNGTTIFANNTSGGNGGAIDLTKIYFEYAGSLSFSYNTAVFGGALYASQDSSGLKLTGVMFWGNSAEYGGAVFLSAVGTYSFSSYYSDRSDYYYYTICSDCRFYSNSASSTGGAIHSTAGNDYVVNSTFVENSADTGGGMSISGTSSLINVSFEDNKSGDGGGSAISNGGTISKMTGIFFSGNGYHCAPDAFMDLNETAVDGDRFEIVCDGCDIDCEECTIENNHTAPVCSDLLDHTDSRGGIATLETVILDPGYWRATNKSRIILACFNKKACKGGVTGDTEYCMAGYEGPYCAVCSQGYVQTLSHRCSKCSSNTSFGTAVFGVFAGLAGVLLLLFLYYMIRVERGRTTRNSTSRLRKILAIQSLKIIIVSWQIITQFSAVANVVYPSLYQDFLDIVALVNFDFSWLLSAGCLDVDFYVGLVTATAGPATVLALLGVTYTIALRRNYGSDVGRRIVRRKHLNAIILIAFLVYSSASSVIFRTFACDLLDDGNIYLRADYRIECDSPKHEAFMIYSGLMIIVYPLGIPVFFAILLFRNRKFLENVTLRTYNGELIQQSTSSLWKPYKPSIFYFEVVECARRLVLAGIVVFIYPDTAAQIAMTLAMAFIFALMSERLNPYESKWDGWVARIGHVMVVLTMFVALLTKVDVSDEGTQSQNLFAAILVTAHIAMILTGVTEAVLLIYTVRETDSPLPRPRRMPVLPVDSFTSIRLNHGDEGGDSKDSTRDPEHE